MGGTQKVLLIGIASHADRYGDNAWPSIDTLAKYAHVTPRAVQMALNDLVRMGLLFKFVNEGGSRQTAPHMRPNLYRLNMAFQAEKDSKSVANNAANDPLKPASPPEASFTPPPEASFTTPLKPASPLPLKPASPEQSIEPSLNHPRNTSARKRALPAQAPQPPAGVSPQVFADWLEVRKARRAGPVTETVLAGLRAEAAAAGLSLNDALAHCCLSGWQGFKAAWFQRQTVGGAGQGGGQRKTARQELVEGAAAAIFDGATHV